MSEDKTAWVYADWSGLEGPRLMGTMDASIVRGKEIFSFEYHPDWLRDSRHTLFLDPDLQLVEGRQYSNREAPFGLFLDSVPDRWGRLLIDRREAYGARQEGRSAPRLFDSDYLLAVSDKTRMGGLRFKRDPEGPFVGESGKEAIPPLGSLRTLEQASLALEASDPEDTHYLDWLRLLMAPGTSLGGARPKGNVIDPRGALWIAKFPSRQDEFNSGAWEYVVNQMARDAGLKAGEARAERFSNHGHTFLAKRFDRSGTKRIHFASAMALLGFQDRDDHASGVSYLDLANFIETHGAAPIKDLEELWKRILFNVLVSNGDDHLRNHGFILQDKGWRLSPLYDVNPIPWQGGLSLNIDENDNSFDTGLVLEVAPYFRLKVKQAETILIHFRSIISKWETLAGNMGIPRSEIDRMRPAFQLR